MPTQEEESKAQTATQQASNLALNQANNNINNKSEPNTPIKTSDQINKNQNNTPNNTINNNRQLNDSNNKPKIDQKQGNNNMNANQQNQNRNNNNNNNQQNKQQQQQNGGMRRVNSQNNVQNGQKNVPNSNNQNNNNKQNQNKNQSKPNKFNNQNGHFQNQQNNQSNGQNMSKQDTSQQQTEKKFTGRCRLFVGNLPSDISEQEFKDLFSKYGETGECFLNTQRSFGFIKLDTRINAEHAKQELDGFTFKGRCIRVRFASHGAAVKVKNLSPFVSNEYLEQAFSIFGPVERAVVIVDDKGRATGEGIVEFERKPGASQCINRCTENCFILTSYPKPVIVEPLDQKDDEDGLPEKSIIKNQQYHSEREVAPHFASNSLEAELAMKWRDLYELEKQIIEEGKKKVQEAREQLEYEIEVRLIDYKEQKLKEDLRAKQEELQRIEDMRKNEFQRRKDMEIRRQEDDRRRQEEMMYRKQDNMMPPNQRGPGNMANGGPNQQGFDQPLLNQPHIPPGGNNRRFDHQNQQGQFQMGQLAPQQQQAMLAAQLSAFAMAAAGNLNIPGVMFDQQGPGQNMQNNQNQGGRNRDDHHRQGGDNRRNFNNRRGGSHGGRGQHRDDQSPFSGFDPKRPRY